MRRKTSYSQNGLTLTDTLLTIVIGGFILGGVGILYIRGLADNKANIGLQQFVTMQKAVRELYAGSASFTGLDNTLMYNSGFVPADIRTDTVGVMRNVWGGQVNVATNGGTTDFFDLSFEGVPPEACTRIVSYNALAAGSTDGLNSITITANGSDVTFSTFPANLPSVLSACDDANAEATITWVLY